MMNKPHRVTVAWRSGAHANPTERSDWCEENVGEFGYLWTVEVSPDTSEITYLFEQHKDAMLFSLMYS